MFCQVLKKLRYLFNIFIFTFRSNPHLYLKSLTRDNVQLLINSIWELPVERVDEVIVAKLPEPKYILPRSRVIPKPKPLTKWQKFAQQKGIQTKKKSKSKLQWDAELKVRFVFTYQLFVFNNNTICSIIIKKIFYYFNCFFYNCLEMDS